MASQGQRYTVFGFSPELDWRPLHFVDSAPANRICGVCGLLPRVNIFMPCRHVLCQSCYEQCLLEDAHVCPLDGYPFLEEDAQWAYFPLENLLRRKVKCWNEDHGCEAVLSASNLHKHFYEECSYHSMRCPKCSAFVLCSNVCAHRKNNCNSYAAPNMADHPNPSNESMQKAVFVALEAILEEREADMRSGLEKLLRDSSTHCNRLNELSHNINALSETVADLSEKTTRKTNDDSEVARCVSALSENVEAAVQATARKCLEMLEQSNTELRRHFATDRDLLQIVSRTVSALQGTLSRELERATETICRKLNTSTNRIATSKVQERESGHVASDVKRVLLGHNTLNVKHYEFYVKGMKSLKETAMSVGWAGYLTDPVYLGGYYISLGLFMKKIESSVFVYGHYRLHKGAIDEFLKWPFNHSVKLTFVNFSTNRIREFSDETGSNLEHFGGPAVAMNRSIIFNYNCDVEDLEREGYIENDQLWVKWELMPRKSE